MIKLIFNTVAVVLAWVLGHVFLYVYFGFLPAYAATNLFTVITWICLYFYAHYKWSYFMGSNIKRIYVGMDDASSHS